MREVNNFAKALSGISEMGFHELFFPYSRAEKEHRKHIWLANASIYLASLYL
jgi:hypothetical protein